MSSERFKAKRFEPKKIYFKETDIAAYDKSYLETLERNKRWGENSSKFFAPIKKFFLPITKPIADKFSNKIVFLQEEISKFPEMNNLPEGDKKDFTSKISYALSLGFKEKEIFFFGVMQWMFVFLACILWIQMLFWIPQPVWDAVSQCIEDNNGDAEGCTLIADIPLTLWGYFCILLAAFPVGIFSSAMGSAHFMHKQNKESTVVKCVRSALANAWTTWAFHFIDGFITVRQIVNRLPQSGNQPQTPMIIKMNKIRRAKEEALYYAWKIGSAGVLPNMVLGNNLIDSGKNSLKFVRARFVEISKLRAAYSSICWVVGVAAYIGAIVTLLFMGDSIYTDSGGLAIPKIYQYLMIPVSFALLVVMIFLRPIYILTICNLYSDYLASINEQPVLPDDPSTGVKAGIVFGFLCILAILVIIFRDQMGLTAILSSTEIFTWYQ
tara:strand:+ start:170 stop:1483 length:1314 start_codon:yes stop_codon:yes gene_type:complete